MSIISRSTPGKHRRVTSSQTARGRIAMATIAVSAVSGAGVSGTAAAFAAPNFMPAPEHDAGSAGSAGSAAANPVAPESSSPQVLAIAEHKPVIGLDDQLDKAVAAAEEAAEAAHLATDPSKGEDSHGTPVFKPTEGVFTSGFGPRWGTIHKGIDIANAIGTPILAIMDGTVIDAGPASGYGNWIRIKHDDGSISIYGHMVSLNVSVGDRVSAGQNIAGMGNEGFSTGSHLHFEIHPTGDEAVDPVPWFSERGISI
ncbi:endopeptidase [Corynebacterium yudongzhengii]|uniref:M23 family peptidase n=1 Tax=Corynebacterium yudongzhengii TaxID=2080740 RepID=A0A2U1T7T4_9CORY|nr:M23 family metallopeptidase [Corynebacterium yudongzhengii]AWB82317.1 endopeptidase [Corynebacterium yudongzhengii]PWC02064.1 M23 family peptidase [Corynebacterium yudongzhengii]